MGGGVYAVESEAEQGVLLTTAWVTAHVMTVIPYLLWAGWAASVMGLCGGSGPGFGREEQCLHLMCPGLAACWLVCCAPVLRSWESGDS